MADEKLRCGDNVRVIGPAATSPRDTFAIGKETTVAELRTDDDGHTVYACQIHGWGFVPFPRVSLERLDATKAISQGDIHRISGNVAQVYDVYEYDRCATLMEHQETQAELAEVLAAFDRLAYLERLVGALPPIDERGR